MPESSEKGMPGRYNAPGRRLRGGSFHTPFVHLAVLNGSPTGEGLQCTTRLSSAVRWQQPQPPSLHRFL